MATDSQVDLPFGMKSFGARPRPEERGTVSIGGHRIATTPVFYAYWRFAAERQRIFYRRLQQVNGPLTDDPILRRFKFTNTYRASDRVSQFLIRSVIYRDDLPNDEINLFFRILLFKLFNKIETWQLLETELGLLIPGRLSLSTATTMSFPAECRAADGYILLPISCRRLATFLVIR